MTDTAERDTRQLGADRLAAAMRRAGKPEWEIARAVKAALEYGMVEALLLDDTPQRAEELSTDYVYRRPRPGRSVAELEAERRRLDAEWRSEHTRIGQSRYWERRRAESPERKPPPEPVPAVQEPAASVAASAPPAEPVPDTRPDPGPRCRVCRYLISSIGHRVNCE